MVCHCLGRQEQPRPPGLLRHHAILPPSFSPAPSTGPHRLRQASTIPRCCRNVPPDSPLGTEVDSRERTSGKVSGSLGQPGSAQILRQLWVRSPAENQAVEGRTSSYSPVLEPLPMSLETGCSPSRGLSPLSLLEPGSPAILPKPASSEGWHRPAPWPVPHSPPS